ncbi:hypothetical protein EZS27_008614 [termite gut metagenome]|uniref:Uncharacterized protein n=1 Tax=termite gut metagenome TaxID=433724 RepID=A0A5J4SCC2_9ZZZZ
MISVSSIYPFPNLSAHRFVVSMHCYSSLLSLPVSSSLSNRADRFLSHVANVESSVIVVSRWVAATRLKMRLP